MRRTKPLRKKESKAKLALKSFFLNGRTLTFIFVMAGLGMSFVFIRMQGIEQDYKYSSLSKEVKIKRLENKELKAVRAKELSVKKLRDFAEEFNLKEPTEDHIIVIPQK